MVGGWGPADLVVGRWQSRCSLLSRHKNPQAALARFIVGGMTDVINLGNVPENLGLLIWRIQDDTLLHTGILPSAKRYDTVFTNHH